MYQLSNQPSKEWIDETVAKMRSLLGDADATTFPFL